MPDTSKMRFVQLLKEIGGEIISNPGNQKETALLQQIESGLKDVVDIRAGKIERVSLSESLRG